MNNDKLPERAFKYKWSVMRCRGYEIGTAISLSREEQKEKKKTEKKKKKKSLMRVLFPVMPLRKVCCHAVCLVLKSNIFLFKSKYTSWCALAWN